MKVEADLNEMEHVIYVRLGSERWLVEQLAREARMVATEPTRDLIGLFLRDRTVDDPSVFTLGREMYARFAQYCIDGRERHIPSHRNLSLRLDARGYKLAKIGGKRGYRGIKLLTNSVERV